jgi:hypothetical protein
VVVILAEEILSVRWAPGTARVLFLMLLQGAVPATSVTVSVDLATPLLRAVPSVSLLGNDMDLSLPFHLKRALVREMEAVPAPLLVCRASAASLSEATVAILLRGVRLVRVILVLALSVLSAPSELPLLLRRTCNGATECVLTPPSLPRPMVALPLHPLFPTHPPLRVDVLA